MKCGSLKRYKNMASISKLINLTKSLTIKTVFTNIPYRAVTTSQRTSLLCSSLQCLNTTVHGSSISLNKTCQIHATSVQHDLMEFFDDKKNWSENEVKVGRAWKKEELRIKSNKELHQLWYILLKERNMLLTMEHEYNDKMEVLPSPERIDKVKISMGNLETVVRERNRTYHELETGQNGERPTKLVANQLGIKFNYKYCEHVLPPYINIKYLKSRSIGYGGYAVRKFLRHYREKLYNEKRKAKNRSRNHVMMLLRRNPQLDVDLLRRKFPDVDIDKLRKSEKTRGHFVPKIEE